MANIDRPGRRPSRSLLVALGLASLSLMILDQQTGENSPVDPARAVVGEALGPVESVTDTVVRPVAAIPEWFRSQSSLRGEVAELQAENAGLRRELKSGEVDANRVAEVDGLTRTAADTGHALVPARVIGIGPMQSLSRTVTINAGTSSGVHADMTVLNNDGLVGRVVHATSSTATVMLIIDADSVVGGRIGRSMEIGFVRGPRSVQGPDRLDLDLVDDALVPQRDDTVLTWGSKGGSPYVADIPIGRVTQIYVSPRETSRRAVIEPYVDFSSLDVVGVVVPKGTQGDRELIEAGSTGDSEQEEGRQ